MGTATFLDRSDLGPLFRSDLSGQKSGPAAIAIGRGQSFYEAMAARNVSHEDIMAIVKDTKDFRDLRQVKSGDVFQVHITVDGRLKSLAYDLDDESYVTWLRNGDRYVRQDGTYPVEHRFKGVSGTIESSLYASLKQIGAPLSLAPKMNDILGWEIDFQRDLRRGDTYRILYDEVWREGRLIRTGAIKAITLTNRGRECTAFLFTAGDRPYYYDADGRNMQKQLSRAPLNYSRISDHFTHRRFHPVLKRWMPHLGVDYAAPLGTPVRAGGDGIVVEATRKKGNGKYIRIRHTNREYETYYLHLSRFAKAIAAGVPVGQGQIIGYVGATGYATGPHLDYRVKHRGRFVDPRRLKLPAAAPVPAGLRAEFAALAARNSAALLSLAANQTVTLAPARFLVPPAWEMDPADRKASPLVVSASPRSANGGFAAKSPPTLPR